MKILVEGIETQYFDAGTGPVVLLLHGWGSDSRAFLSVTEGLKSDFRVISLDLPGFGGTSLSDSSGWHLANYTSFVKQFLDKLEVEDLYAVVGHSMGGRLAIKMAGENTVGFKKMVLLGAHGINQPSAKNTGYKVLAKLGKIATFWLPTKAKNHLKQKLYQKAGADDYVNASPVLRQTFKKIMAEDLRAVAGKIQKPTLIIYGQNDTTTPPSFGEIYHGLITNSQLEIINGAGHFVQNDEPEMVVKLLKEFLR